MLTAEKVTSYETEQQYTSSTMLNDPVLTYKKTIQHTDENMFLTHFYYVLNYILNGNWTNFAHQSLLAGLGRELHMWRKKSCVKPFVAPEIVLQSMTNWCHLSQCRLGLKTTRLKKKKICGCWVRKKYVYKTSVASLLE